MHLKFNTRSPTPYCSLSPHDIRAGADPGEVKRVNFHPPFSEPPPFFSYPSNIEIIFDFSDFSD